jgi:hypothetical protein
MKTAILVSLLVASPLFALRPRIAGGPTDLQIACFVWAGNRPAIEETLAHVAAHRFDNPRTLAPFFVAHADRVAAGRGLYEWMHERAHCAPIALNLTADEAYSYRESVEIVAAVRVSE